MVDTTKDGAMALSMAMIAVKATIDGQALTFEEVCDLPDSDVWVLMGACTGKGLSSPPTT